MAIWFRSLKQKSTKSQRGSTAGVDGFVASWLKKRTRGRVRRPSSDKECNFTGIQDSLAEDLVEEVQAIVSGILSGKFWGLE